LTEERVAFTDEKGMYRMESLPVGDYILEFHERARGDSGYPVVLWPGVTAESASPVAVRAGTESNGGTFSYSKAMLGRIRGTAGSSCDRDQGYQVNLQQRAGGALLKRQFEPAGCGQPFSLEDVSPGSYRLLLIAPERDLMTMSDVDVPEGADLDLQLRLTDAAAITGRVICDCEKPEGLRIVFQPADENGIVSDIDVRDDGTFGGLIGVVGAARVEFQNLPPQLYVKRFVYAGSEAGHVIDVQPGSSVAAEITLGEGPATINGTTAADNSHIVIARWPVPVSHGEAEFESAQVDKDGHFKIGGIVPGTYRIAKVNVMDWQHKDEPGAVEEWLDSGQEITLAENETRNIMFLQK
jgi:Ni/Co efflux regulator RcnB